MILHIDACKKLEKTFIHPFQFMYEKVIEKNLIWLSKF